ncbi:MAG: hypothetical protein BGO41_15820 [Clostridiales bacterium 38-18]|nr:MAG: hypothetical protein BGO41_15820 [Clostridiales bacterium 38-18]
MYDVAIIGAGVVGSLIAREFSRFNLSCILLDKENDVACGATKANTALIHAGYDASYKSLKGKLNARGNQLYTKLSEELNFPFKRIGSMVLGMLNEDRETIERLFENGVKLGIKDLKIIYKDEINRLEPNVDGAYDIALFAATAGITEPWEIAISACENAMNNGVELRLNYEVCSIEKQGDQFIINSDIQTKWIINCAGVHADEIFSLIEPTQNIISISPRKGEYFLLDKKAGGLVNHILFTCPTSVGKGVVISPTAHGNIIIGPNSEWTEKDDTKTTFAGLDEVLMKSRGVMKKIPVDLNIANFAGIRAEPELGDFIIEKVPDSNFINVAGIKSPGLSASPAIAEYVLDIFRSAYEPIDKLLPNPDFNPVRPSRINFMGLSDEDQNKLIEENPAYAHIVCRCEQISEAEIVDAVRRKCGARSMNGVKRRVRPGAGRCQGGFCGPKVIEIIARELGVSLEEVDFEKNDSKVLMGDNRYEE